MGRKAPPARFPGPRAHRPHGTDSRSSACRRSGCSRRSRPHRRSRPRQISEDPVQPPPGQVRRPWLPLQRLSLSYRCTGRRRAGRPVVRVIPPRCTNSSRVSAASVSGRARFSALAPDALLFTKAATTVSSAVPTAVFITPSSITSAALRVSSLMVDACGRYCYRAIPQTARPRTVRSISD